ncbi:MAG: hypothetical protein ACKO3G_15975 [Planctomycetaceae bacterium]
MPDRRLLVFTIDRLPAWILPAYGATWVSTPALDGLAAAGVVLDRLVATALAPAPLIDEIVGPLPADAAAAGQAPAVVTDDAAVAERHGGGGVEAVVVPVPGVARRARDVRRTALGALFAAAHEALLAGRGLVWVHASSLGTVWDAPEAFDEPYVDPEDPRPPAGCAVPSLRVDRDTDPDLVVGWRQRMAGQVSLLDRLVGGLVASLPGGRHGAWSVCVVGIRGLPLGIHGLVGNPPAPADEVPFGESIQLPAILRAADGAMAGQRYGGIVVPADIGATLRELAGLPPGGGAAAAADARSLCDLLARWEHRHRDRAISVGAGGVAVTPDAWRWIEGEEGNAPDAGGAGRLHALPDDFFEMCDVADRCPAEAAALAHVAALARAGRLEEAGAAPLAAGGPPPSAG